MSFYDMILSSLAVIIQWVDSNRSFCPNELQLVYILSNSQRGASLTSWKNIYSMSLASRWNVLRFFPRTKSSVLWMSFYDTQLPFSSTWCFFRHSKSSRIWARPPSWQLRALMVVYQRLEEDKLRTYLGSGMFSYLSES